MCDGAGGGCGAGSGDGNVVPSRPDSVLGATARETCVKLRLHGSSDAAIWIVPVGGQVLEVQRLNDGIFDAALRGGTPHVLEQWERDPCFRGNLHVDREINEAAAADHASAVRASREPETPDPVRSERVRSSQIVRWARRAHLSDALQEALARHAAGGGELAVFRDAPGPIQIRVQEPLPTLAMGVLNLCRIPEANDLLVHILAVEERYAPRGRARNMIVTNLVIEPSARAELPAIHAAVIGRMRAIRPGTIVTEHAGSPYCDFCDGRSLGYPEQAVLAGSPPDQDRPWVSQLTRDGDLMAAVRTDLEACHARTTAAHPEQAIGRMRVVLRDGQVEVHGSMFVPSMDSCVRRKLQEMLEHASWPWSHEGARLHFRATRAEHVDGFAAGPDYYFHVHTRLRVPLGPGGRDVLAFQPARPVSSELNAGWQLPSRFAQSSDQNHFRSRYLLRHPWVGGAACERPRFGVWDDVAPESGPMLPGGVRTARLPEAIAHRSVVVDDVSLLTRAMMDSEPRLEVVAARPAPPAPPPPPVAPAAATRGSGMCAASNEKSPAAWIATGLLLLVVRRRYSSM